MGRILTVARAEKKKPLVYIICSAGHPLVEGLVARFRHKNCQVVCPPLDKIPIAYCDYLIVLGLDSLPPGCILILRRAKQAGFNKPTLLFVDDEANPALAITYQWLKQKISQYDIRIIEAKTDQMSADDLIKKLFSHKDPNTDKQILTKRLSQLSTDKVIPKMAKPTKDKAGVSTSLVSQHPSFTPPTAATGVKDRLVERRFFISKKMLTAGIILPLFFLFILSPLLFLSFKVSLGFVGLYRLSNSLSRAQLNIEELTFTTAQFESARQLLSLRNTLPGPFVAGFPFNQLDNLTSIGESLTSLGKEALVISKLTRELTTFLFLKEPFELEVLLDQFDHSLTVSNRQLTIVYEKLSLVEADRLLSLPWLRSWQTEIAKLKLKLAEVGTIISFGQQIIPWLPQALGSQTGKVYLIIFQNNMELRPGGGFIGSFALVTFDKGQLVDLQVEDIYTADGQLKGHVDPPEPIRRYLNQPHWYMRDSNFDPDFPTSASQVEWFLAKELGIKVDGTLALDLTFIANLIDALGGIYLTDYGEFLTGDNLFLKAQTYIQDDFFPGSTRKKDFLASLTRALLIELTTNSSLPWLKLGQVTKRALDEKHLLVVLHEPRLQQLFDQASWSGKVAAVSCIEWATTCIPDYFAVSEANLGVNKANSYLQRSFNHRLTISSSAILHSVAISFSNQIKAPVFPSGHYKSYLRLLLPTAADEVSLNVEETPEMALEVDHFAYQDKQVAGFFINVPVGSQRTVNLSYRLPLVKNNGYELYQLHLQKQPGTASDSLELTIDLDDVMIRQTNFPLTAKGSAEVVGDKLVASNRNWYNSSLSLKNVAGRQTNIYNSYIADLSVDRLFRLLIQKERVGDEETQSKSN